jgi:hypothetical protein
MVDAARGAGASAGRLGALGESEAELAAGDIVPEGPAVEQGEEDSVVAVGHGRALHGTGSSAGWDRIAALHGSRSEPSGGALP